MAHIGEIIAAKREAKGWTLYELSKRAGVAWAYLSRLETDPKTSPSFETVERLALAFECSLEDFRTLEGGEKKPEKSPRPT